MNLLVDRGLLVLAADGIALRTDDDRADILGWLRPVVVRTIHRLVADEVDVSPLQRARHLLAAGDPRELATWRSWS